MLKLGVIGFGSRISGIVNLLLETKEVELAAVMDVRNAEIKEKFALVLKDENMQHNIEI